MKSVSFYVYLPPLLGGGGDDDDGVGISDPPESVPNVELYVYDTVHGYDVIIEGVECNRVFGVFYLVSASHVPFNIVRAVHVPSHECYINLLDDIRTFMYKGQRNQNLTCVALDRDHHVLGGNLTDLLFKITVHYWMQHHYEPTAVVTIKEGAFYWNGIHESILQSRMLQRLLHNYLFVSGEKDKTGYPGMCYTLDDLCNMRDMLVCSHNDVTYLNDPLVCILYYYKFHNDMPPSHKDRYDMVRELARQLCTQNRANVTHCSHPNRQVCRLLERVADQQGLARLGGGTVNNDAPYDYLAVVVRYQPVFDTLAELDRQMPQQR